MDEDRLVRGHAGASNMLFWSFAVLLTAFAVNGGVAQELDGTDLAARMTIGARVVRGKDWKYGNEDGGVGGQGTVIRGLLDGLVRVEWDSSPGLDETYRMGQEGKYDLALALSDSELAARMVVGARVVRGRDWEYNDNDGGIGKVGTVTRGVVDGLVRVEWDARPNESESYRMGRGGKYDLYLAPPTPPPQLVTTAAPPAAPTRPVTVAPPKPTPTIFTPTQRPPSRTKPKLNIGDHVVKGKDWQWGDQDGGTGGVGIVVQSNVPGWVGVKWFSGGYNTYRFGFEEKYDLDLAKTSYPNAKPAASVNKGGIITPSSMWNENEIFGKKVAIELYNAQGSCKKKVIQDVWNVINEMPEYIRRNQCEEIVS